MLVGGVAFVPVTVSFSLCAVYIRRRLYGTSKTGIGWRKKKKRMNGNHNVLQSQSLIEIRD